MNDRRTPGHLNQPGNGDYPERPDHVGYAVILLYVSAALGIVLGILYSIEYPGESLVALLDVSSSAVILIIVAVNALSCLLIYLTGTGRNWARILVLIGIFGFVPKNIVLVVTEILSESPVLGMLDLGWSTMQFVALVFLIHKPTTEWFKEMKAARAA